MRSRSKQLARHSINSALAAIAIYNKPAFPDREQIFAVLMVTAWEALLKARILHLAKNKLTALFVREKAKRFKRNRNKVPFTVDIYEAMRRLNLDPVVASNTGHLVEIRDSAVHLTVESASLPQIVFSLGTATLRNYARLVHEWFHMPLSTRPLPQPAKGGRRPGRLTSGARNPGPQNASRGVHDCSWSLWRPQERAPQAS